MFHRNLLSVVSIHAYHVIALKINEYRLEHKKKNLYFQSLHKVLSPGLPEDVKRFELQQLLHPNPLLLLQDNPPPGVASHVDAFNQALARVKHSLGASGFSLPPASPQQPVSSGKCFFKKKSLGIFFLF